MIGIGSVFNRKNTQKMTVLSPKDKKLTITKLFAQSIYLLQQHWILNHISATNDKLGLPDAYAVQRNL